MAKQNIVLQIVIIMKYFIITLRGSVDFDHTAPDIDLMNSRAIFVSFIIPDDQR